MSPVLREYLLRCGTALDPALAGLSERTAALGDIAVMLVPTEEAALLTILTRLLGARTPSTSVRSPESLLWRWPRALHPAVGSSPAT